MTLWVDPQHKQASAWQASHPPELLASSYADLPKRLDSQIESWVNDLLAGLFGALGVAVFFLEGQGAFGGFLFNACAGCRFFAGKAGCAFTLFTVGFRSPKAFSAGLAIGRLFATRSRASGAGRASVGGRASGCAGRGWSGSGLSPQSS